MHVRKKTDDVGIERQSKRTIEAIISIARGDIDLLVDEDDRANGAFGRLICQIQPDRGLLWFRFSTGMEMKLHDQITVFGPAHCQSLRQWQRIFARSPDPRRAWKPVAGCGQAGAETRARIERFFPELGE